MIAGQNINTIYARSWLVSDSPCHHHPAVFAAIALENEATVTYHGDWESLARPGGLSGVPRYPT